MRRRERAVELFRQNFNCSQAVFAAYRQADALDEASALKLATVFGAGVACTGHELCGAATGALLAISMKHGMGDPESTGAKAKTYELGRHFLEEFESRMGSCRCEGILGFSIGTPESLERARSMRLFETRCVDAVKAASEILEGMP
jgi:C_GCAxxG_C_C family probable redox protein